MTSYGDKMANDKFDGTQGFSIDGGIKDARYRLPLHRAKALLSVTHPQPHPATHLRAQLSYACHRHRPPAHAYRKGWAHLEVATGDREIRNP